MLVRDVKFQTYLRANINNKGRLRYLWKTPLRFSSWVCLGSLNRSSPTLDDSSWTYQTALPQPFVAFLSPLTYQRLFRIRCGVATSILTESLTGFLSSTSRPTRKRSSTPVLTTRIASVSLLVDLRTNPIKEEGNDVSMSKPTRASSELGPRKSPQEQSACRGRGKQGN